MTINRRQFVAGVGGASAVGLLGSVHSHFQTTPPPSTPLRVHVDLSSLGSVDCAYLVVGARRFSLKAHTQTSAHVLRTALPAMHQPLHGDGTYSHHATVDAEWVGHKVMRVHVRRQVGAMPSASDPILHVAMVSHAVGHLPGQMACGEDPDGVAIRHTGMNFTETAKAFLFHHPDVVTQDPRVHAEIDRIMSESPEVSGQISNLALVVRRMGPPAAESGWARLVRDEAASAHFGKPLDNLVPTDEFNAQAFKALAPLVIAIKNSAALKDAKWTIEEGKSVTTRSAPQSALPHAASVGTGGSLLPVAFHPQNFQHIAATAASNNWQVALHRDDVVSGLWTRLSIVDAGRRRVRLSLRNNFLRYLGVYIRFRDAGGQPISLPGWRPDPATDLHDYEDHQEADVRYLGTIQPINTVLAVPIIGQEGGLEVEFEFPERATRADILAGGLGTGRRDLPRATIVGGVMTGLMNFTVPALMLGFSAAIQRSQPLYAIMDDAAIKVVLAVGYLGHKVEGIIKTSVEKQSADFRDMTSLSGVLFGQACRKLLAYAMVESGAEEAEHAVPFVGWIMLAIDLAAGIAQAAETTAEVCVSPWVIENHISETITTVVHVHPDPRNKAFPQGYADYVQKGAAMRSWQVRMVFRDAQRPTVRSADSGDFNDPTAQSLTARFPGNTLGGQVKFEAEFYIGTWLAARATTGWMDNDGPTVSTLDMYLVQTPVPLSSASVYHHSAILSYRGDRYTFISRDQPPTATRWRAGTNVDSTTGAIMDLSGLTLSQRFGLLGLSWSGVGLGMPECGHPSGGGAELYGFASLNIPGTPMNDVRFANCAFRDKTRLVYDVFPPKFLQDARTGQWVLAGTPQQPVADPADRRLGDYFVDPSKSNDKVYTIAAGRGYHLRRIDLHATGDFDTNANNSLSWGRFAYFPDYVTMHPSGHVIGVNSQYHKLMALRLEPQGLPDAEVPLCRYGSGKAQNEDRPGLMFRPLAVACTYDGTVIVLEESRTEQTVVARLGAYNLDLNPVRGFPGRGTQQRSFFLYLDDMSDFTLLDMAAVGNQFLTYIYVLFHAGDGRDPQQYQLALYEISSSTANTKPLVVTRGVAAGKIAVDMWHTAYTLNFETVTDAAGNPAGPKAPGAPPGGRSVPSVSMWLPPVPRGTT